MVLRFWFEKDVMRPLRLRVGAGRLELAVLVLAVVESLLPNTRFQPGPPS